MLITPKTVPPHRGFEEYFQKAAKDPHFGSKALANIVDSCKNIAEENWPMVMLEQPEFVDIRLPSEGVPFTLLELAIGTVTAWCLRDFEDFRKTRFVHPDVVAQLEGAPEEYGIHAQKFVTCVSLNGEIFVAFVPIEDQICSDLIAYGYAFGLQAASREWVTVSIYENPESRQQSFQLEMDNHIAEYPQWDAHINCIGLLAKAILADPELLITDIEEVLAA